MTRWSPIVLLSGTLVLLLVSAAHAQEEAAESEATETESTESEAPTDATESEATETEEGSEVELDCDGADLGEFTARLTAAAESRGVEPPSSEQVADLFARADENSDGRLGRAEADRLAERSRHPGRQHARVWRHRIRCHQSAE